MAQLSITPSFSRPKFKRCILHIGTEKTGTKAIQTYLRSVEAKLLTSGILFPTAADRGNLSQWEFAAVAHHAPWKQDIGRVFGITDALSQIEFTNQLRDTLTREFNANRNADTLVISSEHFQSRLTSVDDITRLRDFLALWVEQFEIIVYFRRQDQMALSFMSTRLKSSVKIHANDYLRTMGSTPNYYLYDQIFSRWSEVFGKSNIQARIYDPAEWIAGDLTEDFCRSVDLPHPASKILRVNQSLSPKAFHFLRVLNELYPSIPGDRNDPIRSALVRQVAILYPGKFYPIARADAEAFYQQFQQTNLNLQRLAFPDRQTSLFSNDFSEYPETADDHSPKYEDAVEIAVELWRGMHHDEDRRKKSWFARLLKLIK